ncbi:hypothetical protein J6590_067981 [Homalodisca vitripennis]|nr:hypothetical protein J6590_067981 [Homalodisca vitripennis]
MDFVFLALKYSSTTTQFSAQIGPQRFEHRLDRCGIETVSCQHPMIKSPPIRMQSGQLSQSLILGVWFFKNDRYAVYRELSKVQHILVECNEEWRRRRMMSLHHNCRRWKREERLRPIAALLQHLLSKLTCLCLLPEHYPLQGRVRFSNTQSDSMKSSPIPKFYNVDSVEFLVYHSEVDRIGYPMSGLDCRKLRVHEDFGERIECMLEIRLMFPDCEYVAITSFLSLSI